MSFKKSRKAAGIKINDAAKSLGVSRQTVSAWEHGVSKPETHRLKEIAKLYGCTIDDLLKDE